MITKWLFMLIVSVCMPGCMYQITSAGDISAAEEVCATHGGVNHITVVSTGDERVVCQDEFDKYLHRQR